MPPSFVDFHRCHDPETVEEIKTVLGREGIPIQLASSTGISSESWMGMSGRDAGGTIIVQVPADQCGLAMAAMDKEYLKSGLPEDHFLHRASDDDLTTMLGETNTWNPYDMAHARRLIEERGIDPAAVAARKAEYQQQLILGRRAPSGLVAAGWICAFLGGIFGALIGWSLSSSKETTPAGEFYTYDEASRKTGHAILALSCLSSALIFLLWAYRRLAD